MLLPQTLSQSVGPRYAVNGGPENTRGPLTEDSAWCLTLPCKVGVKSHIYTQSRTELAFCGIGTSLRKKLLKIPGVLKHQTGGEEFSVKFPNSAFSQVARVVRPLKRRGPNPQLKGGKSTQIQAIDPSVQNSLSDGSKT